MTSPSIIRWAAMSAITFLITFSLFMFSVIKKYWHEQGAPKSVRISLTVCAIFYLSANLLGLVHFVLLAIYAPKSTHLEDPKDHPAVVAEFYLLLLVYVVAILLNIFVWIERVKYVYTDSAYGFSARFIKGLKIGYLCIVVFVVILMAAIPFNDGERKNYAVWVIIRVGAIMFVLSFVCISATVSAAFIVKLKSMQGVLRRFQADDKEAFIFVQDLTQLQMKLTVLVCVQVLSTLVCVVLVVPLEGAASMMPLSVDAFLGFMCIYCTLATHDFAFNKACCCCIRCCALCVKIPEKMQKRAKVEVEATTVHSKTTTEVEAAEPETTEVTVQAEQMR